MDLIPATGASDSTGNAFDDSAFWVAVRIAGAQGLDSYGFELGFDTALLSFVQAAPASVPDGLANFLESQGGVSAGFVGQLLRRDSTQVSIANALIAHDSAKAPSGGGLVALIKFQPKLKPGNARFSFSATTLLDWRQQVDTGIAVIGARQTLQSRPVPVWKHARARTSPAPADAAFVFDARNLLGRSVSFRRLR